MKKMVLTLAAITLTFSLAGCATDNKQQKTEKDENNEIGKMIETPNDLQIKVKDVKTGFGQSTDKKDMLQVTFSVKNISKETSGAGANDFKVETDNGKVYPVYGLEAKNFGTEIKAGETITGTGYYEIPAGVKQAIVYYQPLDKKMAQWKVKVPKK